MVTELGRREEGRGGPVAEESHVAADARALAESLTAFTRIIQFRDRDRACCYDVSATECHALEVLVDGGVVTVNDLAGALFVDKSTASRLVGGLERLGYVRKARGGVDGRQVRIEVTGRGRALAGRIREDLVGEYAGLLRDVEPSVRRAMPEVVRRITRSLAARVEVANGRCCIVD